MYLKILFLLFILSFSFESLGREIHDRTSGYYFQQTAQTELGKEKNKAMPKKSNKEICISYLSSYAQKDLNSIQEMFSEDIVLRDWKIRVVGKKNALLETHKNFESADSIEIEVLSTYENTNTVAAELKITVDKTEELYVVDVITINSNGKINSIRAYLGRGNH